MPRLRKRRKLRKSLDFEKALSKFLADTARKLWFYGSSVGIRVGAGAIVQKRAEKGEMVLAVLRGASNAVELSQGRRSVTVQEFLGEPVELEVKTGTLADDSENETDR